MAYLIRAFRHSMTSGRAFDTNVDPTSLVDWDTLFSELDTPFVSI